MTICVNSWLPWWCGRSASVFIVSHRAHRGHSVVLLIAVRRWMAVCAQCCLSRTGHTEDTETFGIWWSMNPGHCEMLFVSHRGRRGHGDVLLIVVRRCMSVCAICSLSRTGHTETFGIWWWSINLGHCDIPFVSHRGAQRTQWHTGDCLRRHESIRNHNSDRRRSIIALPSRDAACCVSTAASLLLRLYGCRGNRYNVASILFVTRKQALQ